MSIVFSGNRETNVTGTTFWFENKRSGDLFLVKLRTKSIASMYDRDIAKLPREVLYVFDPLDFKPANQEEQNGVLQEILGTFSSDFCFTNYTIERKSETGSYKREFYCIIPDPTAGKASAAKAVAGPQAA